MPADGADPWLCFDQPSELFDGIADLEELDVLSSLLQDDHSHSAALSLPVESVRGSQFEAVRPASPGPVKNLVAAETAHLQSPCLSGVCFDNLYGKTSWTAYTAFHAFQVGGSSVAQLQTADHQTWQPRGVQVSEQNFQWPATPSSENTKRQLPCRAGGAGKRPRRDYCGRENNDGDKLESLQPLPREVCELVGHIQRSASHSSSLRTRRPRNIVQFPEPKRVSRGRTHFSKDSSPQRVPMQMPQKSGASASSPVPSPTPRLSTPSHTAHVGGAGRTASVRLSSKADQLERERQRNQLHAQRARERKRQNIEQLKCEVVAALTRRQQLRDLLKFQHPTSTSEPGALACVVEALLKNQFSGVTDQKAWQQLVTPDFELQVPATSIPGPEQVAWPQSGPTEIVRGVAQLTEHVAAMQQYVDRYIGAHSSVTKLSKDALSVVLEPSSVMTDACGLMGSWTVQLVSGAGASHVILDGMLECAFDGDNRIQRLNLVYDPGFVKSALQSVAARSPTDVVGKFLC